MVAFILTLAFQRIMKQPILLLDEVDAALDVNNSAAMASGMKELMDGVQIIAVSHRKHLPLIADNVLKVGKPNESKNGTKVMNVD